MKRYRLFTTLCAMLSLAVFFSCSNEEDDLFDQSAAHRLNASVKNYQQLITSSENGWAMEYFPSQKEMGGFAYTAKFDGSSVELRASFNKSGNGTTIKCNDPKSSMYSIVSEQGIILTFDTYNPLLHYFSQPNGPSDVDGYASDYEFEFQRVSEQQDSIFLKGKKYGNEMIMVRLNQNPEKYIDQVLKSDTAIAMVPRPQMVVGEKKYSISISNRFFNVMFGNDSVLSMPYVYNDHGFRLYQPIEIDGNTYSNFNYDEGTGNVLANVQDAVIPYPTKIQQFQGTKNLWLAPFDVNTDEHEMCDELWTLYKDNYKFSSYQTVVAFGIGLDPYYTNGITPYPMCLYFSVDMFHMMQQPCGNSITLDVDEDNSIITLTPIEKSSNYKFYAKSLDPLNDFILANSPYRISFNEGKIATSAHLVSVNNENVWFNLNLSE